jgi:hypothetical protein
MAQFVKMAKVEIIDTVQIQLEIAIEKCKSLPFINLLIALCQEKTKSTTM